MCFPASSYLRLNLRDLLIAGLALFVAATAYAQDSDSSDVAALKAQMEECRNNTRTVSRP